MQARRICCASILLSSAVCLAQPGPPANLRCEYRVNPLGIDTAAPRLSWQIVDARRGAAQSAYQVVVGPTRDLETTPGLIDTGMVRSDASVHVVIPNLRPESGRRYYWRVRTWDAQGRESPWSEPAWWEMGLLRPEDWKARWVTASVPPERDPRIPWGSWIWSARAPAQDATLYFRLPVSVDPTSRIEEASIRLTADNAFELWINGNRRAQGGNWQNVYSYDLSDDLKPGQNVIALKCTNADGPAGLLVAGRIHVAGGKTIDFRSDASWKVTLTETEGWTEPGFDDSAWQPATVIAPYGGEPWKQLREAVGPRRSMCVRREFTVRPGIVRARAYASGLGLYELHLNGKRVAGDVFTPGWTHYPKRIQYQTYDVTERLRAGPNAVGAILGNGWWSGGLGWAGREQYSDGPLRFLLQLAIDYEDGSRDTVVTDGGWQTTPSPITRDSFYGGETYDATLELPGWDSPGFTGKWQPVGIATDQGGRLVAEACEPIRVTQEIPALQITEVEKGVFVADFGQNAAGRVKIRVRGPRGTRVRLRFAEVLTPDGRLYRDNYRTAESTDAYILRGSGEEEWEPRFTYRGLRFCEITGYPGTPAKEAVTMCVLHTAAEPAGHFECAHWLVNEIWQAITWGQRSNLHSVPTDCPQRDERLGWMGDAQTFGPTACWNMHLGAFFTKWMRDVTDSQAQDGSVTDVSPVVVVKGPAAPGWGDAVTVVPWTIYQYYGDRRILEENYGAMAGWVEYMRRNSRNDLYEREGYGDWVAPVASPKKPIGTAYYYRSTDILSRAATVLGREEDARKYAALAERIAVAFNKAYLDPAAATYTGGTQTANLLPLSFGITPPDQREAVFASLVRDIRARGDHLSTGFLGTPCLMPVLTDFGRQDLAWRLATQTTYPSWGYMIRNGATTIWELWDSDKRDPAMNSRNHFALGVVGQWFFEDLVGIRPAAPGFKRILIRPRPPADLGWAQAEYPSLYGPIRCAWRRMPPARPAPGAAAGLRVQVSIPPNTTAEIRLPVVDGTPVLVTETGQRVYPVATGAPAGTPALEFDRAEAGELVFRAGAGDFDFLVTPQ